MDCQVSDINNIINHYQENPSLENLVLLLETRPFIEVMLNNFPDDSLIYIISIKVSQIIDDLKTTEMLIRGFIEMLATKEDSRFTENNKAKANKFLISNLIEQYRSAPESQKDSSLLAEAWAICESSCQTIFIIDSIEEIRTLLVLPKDGPRLSGARVEAATTNKSFPFHFELKDYCLALEKKLGAGKLSAVGHILDLMQAENDGVIPSRIKRKARGVVNLINSPKKLGTPKLDRKSNVLMKRLKRDF